YFSTNSGVTSNVQLVGTGNQSISGVGVLHDLDISKASGDVLMLDALQLGEGQLTGAGSIKNTGGIMEIISTYIFDLGGDVDDLEFNTTGTDVYLFQDLVVNNDLTITAVNRLRNDFNYKVSGDVIATDLGYFSTNSSVTSNVQLVGTTDQSITGVGVLHDLYIAKPSGDVLMSAFNLTFNQVEVTVGTWDVLGNTVTATNFDIHTNGVATGTGVLVGGIDVETDGTLGGDLVVTGNVQVTTGGTINAGNTIGQLTIDGNLTMGTGTTVFIDFTSGSTPGTTYDQVVVNGTTTISNATLAGNATGFIGATLTILDNDATDAVIGTFSGLAEGGIINIGGVNYMITYMGGSGNDIELTANFGKRYVDLNATGANNGLSWNDAYTSLKDALDLINLGDTIWVAAGTYKASTGTDRMASFMVPDGVKVYGGFAGGETMLSERNWAANPTILSGDLGAQGDASDNSYNVVRTQDVSKNTILDGLIIEHGNANGTPYPYNRGGGIANNGMNSGNSSPTIQNCIFRWNMGTYGGAISNMSNFNGAVNSAITGCLFMKTLVYGDQPLAMALIKEEAIIQ
ncbi:MAG: hypothetical protein GY810_26135, partial [Aureispira sp.]|nr:hypothetical protein [Aureispira sp.]